MNEKTSAESPQLRVVCIGYSKGDAKQLGEALTPGWPGVEIQSLNTQQTQQQISRESCDCVFCGLAPGQPEFVDLLARMRKQAGDVPLILTGSTPSVHETVDLVKSGVSAIVPREDWERLVPALKKLLAEFSDQWARDDANAKLAHVRQLFGTLTEIGAVIVREQDIDRLYEKVCEIAVERDCFKLAWIGIVDHASGVVRPVAWAGEPSSFLQDLEISVAGDDTCEGPIPTVVRKGKPVVLNDLPRGTESTPRFKDALHESFKSMGSFPLLIEEEVIAVLNVYSDEQGFFHGDEILLMEEVGNEISFALDKLRERQTRKWAEGAIRSLSTTLSRYSGEEFFFKVCKYLVDTFD